MEVYELATSYMEDIRDQILKQLKNLMNEQNCEKIIIFCLNQDINQHHEIIKKAISILLKIMKKENFLQWMKKLKKWPIFYEEVEKKFTPYLIDIVSDIYEENIELKIRLKKLEDAILSLTLNKK